MKSIESANKLAALDAAQAELNKVFAHTTSAQVSQDWSPDLIRFLAISVLIFTFAALVLGTILMWRSKAPASQVLRILGVVSIIGMSSLLLVVGYSNDQLTPIVGLFGAIAGYLLGKDSQVLAQDDGVKNKGT